MLVRKKTDTIELDLEQHETVIDEKGDTNNLITRDSADSKLGSKSKNSLPIISRITSTITNRLRTFKEPIEQKFSPPTQRIAVFSLEAEISDRLIRLTQPLIARAKEILTSQDSKYQDFSILGLHWNLSEAQKYGCFHFTFDPPPQDSRENYWLQVGPLFITAFGEDTAKQTFDDLVYLLPDGVELFIYEKNRHILYENMGSIFLKQSLASFQQYIQAFSDPFKEKFRAKIDAITAKINQKYLQTSAQLELLLSNPDKAEKTFGLKFYDTSKSDSIIHETHIEFVNKVILQFDSEVLSQLELLEDNSDIISGLPTEATFNKVFKQFNYFQNQIKKDHSDLNRDIFHLYPENGMQCFAFSNRHQALTMMQRTNLDEKSSQTITESLKLEPSANVQGKVKHLPSNFKVSQGIFWQLEAKDSSIEAQVCLETNRFHTPISKLNLNPDSQLLNALYNLQQQAQETRRNKIVSHLLAYNQSYDPKLSLSSIHDISLFLSDKISFDIDDQIYTKLSCTARNSHKIMMEALAKFKTENPLISIPEEVKYILGGIAKEVAQTRNIYTHVYNINDQSKYQYDALRIAQYWLEYLAPTPEPTIPGFIYFLWPIVDLNADVKATEAINPEILDNNKAGMVQIFLLFKEFYLDDSLIKAIKVEEFSEYYQLRRSVVQAAREYRGALENPKWQLKLKTQAKLIRQEQIFLAKTQVIYQKLEKKILSSQPTNAMGTLLKIIFTLIKNNSHLNHQGLIPALIHLLVYFMNEKKGLAIQASGGSEGHDGRWELVENILQSLQTYGLKRELVKELHGSIDQLMQPFHQYSPKQYVNQQLMEADKRPQPSRDDLLLLSASSNRRPFFAYWFNKIKPSHLLDPETKILYQYSSQHWLSLEAKLDLLVHREFKTPNFTGKDRDDFDKLTRFKHREIRLLEALKLEQDLKKPKKESKDEKSKSVIIENPALIRVINHYYHRLTRFLIAKESECQALTSIHPKLMQIFEKIKTPPSNLESKYEFILEMNLLAKTLNQLPGVRLFSPDKSKKKPFGKYAGFQSIKEALRLATSIDFSTQENFIKSLRLQAELLDPNKIYFSLIRELNDQQFEEWNAYKKCQNDDKAHLIPEYKNEDLIPEKLRIYWQQQKLLCAITTEENIEEALEDVDLSADDIDLFINKPLAKAINNFYNNVNNILNTLSEEISQFNFLGKDQTKISGKYQLILELYYLAQNSIQSEPNEILEAVLKLDFSNEENFIQSLNDIESTAKISLTSS